MPPLKRPVSRALSIRRSLLWAIGAAALLIGPGPASALPAPVLLATTGGTGSHGASQAPASNLYRLDPATGAATSLGGTGYAITGLAQDPTTGVLYGVSSQASPIAPLELLTLNPTTGAATPVGPLGEQRVADISFDSLGRLFGWSEFGDELVSIEKSSGAATIVGPSGINTFGSGSSFDRNDTYWLMGFGENGAFYTVDTVTGVPTARGTLTPIDENASPVSAAAWDCARTTLYGTLNNQGEPPANLVMIDTTTGALVNRGLTVTAADGLEWYCPLAFEFPSSSFTVGPGKEETIAVPVVRGPRIKGAATVNFSLVPGSAKFMRDYVLSHATISPIPFANNVESRPLEIVLKHDPKAGGNRTFSVVLGAPSNDGTIGPSGRATVTILTAKPKVKVSGPKKTGETRPAFRLRSAQIPARFRCKLDKGRFKGCGRNGKKGKRLKLPSLEPGVHRLVVQAVNGAGRRSAPLRKRFTILP